MKKSTIVAIVVAGIAFISGLMNCLKTVEGFSAGQGYEFRAFLGFAFAAVLFAFLIGKLWGLDVLRVEWNIIFTVLMLPSVIMSLVKMPVAAKIIYDGTFQAIPIDGKEHIVLTGGMNQAVPSSFILVLGLIGVYCLICTLSYKAHK